MSQSIDAKGREMIANTVETGTTQVLASVEDEVGTITLNRPDRRNALSTEMIRGLGRSLAFLENEASVGCIVITGAGSAFCAGGDVLDFNDQGGEGAGADTVDAASVDRQLQEQRETVGRIYSSSVPVVASLPGPAAGAGLGLCLAADLRVGTPESLMVTAFASVGLSGDYGVAWLLNQLVGPAKARELLLLSPRLDGRAAYKMGLLQRLCNDDQLSATTHELAQRLAHGPRTALGHMKRNLLDVVDQTLDQAMITEISRHKECGITADHLEAVKAFVGKRPPVFGRG